MVLGTVGQGDEFGGDREPIRHLETELYSHDVILVIHVDRQDLLRVGCHLDVIDNDLVDVLCRGPERCDKGKYCQDDISCESHIVELFDCCFVNGLLLV